MDEKSNVKGNEDKVKKKMRKRQHTKKDVNQNQIELEAPKTPEVQ